MNYSKQEIIKILSSLDELILYRNFAENNLLRKIKIKLHNLDANQSSSFSQIITELVEFNEKLGLKGDIFKNYLKGIFINDQNSFSLAAEKNTIAKNSSLYQLALNDLALITKVIKFDFYDLIKAFNLKSYSFLSPYQANLINDRNLKIYNTILNNEYGIQDCLKNIIDAPRGKPAWIPYS